MDVTDRLAVVQVVEQDLLEHFQRVPDEISQQDFEPIWAILKKEVHKDILTDDFKSELRSQLEFDFRKMWRNSMLDNGLSILELLKQKFVNDPKPKWRPTNQPVDVQVLPLEIQSLNHKKRYLKESIEREKIEIGELMEKIDEYRKGCKLLNYSRDEVLKEVDEQIEVYEDYLQKPSKIDAVALDMLLN